MNAPNVQAALAQGQQPAVPVDAGACGGGYGAGMAGYGFGGGTCQTFNPGVNPTFNGYVPPGVVASFKTLGACGLLDKFGNVYRFVPGVSTYLASGATIDIGGVAIDAGVVAPGIFVPTVEDIGNNGEVRLTINDGFATVCGWKWTESAGIKINRAAAAKDFVDKIIETPADAFNIDGCECPVAFTCITEDDALELDLQLDCPEGSSDPFIALIQGQTPTMGAVAFGIDAATFAFTLYLNVYETVGTCGFVGPLYNLAPGQTPMLPGAPQGPCGPAALQGAPPMGGYNGMNGGYMQPGMTG